MCETGRLGTSSSRSYRLLFEFNRVLELPTEEDIEFGRTSVRII